MSTPTATPRTDDGLLAVALACEYVKESVTLAGSDMREHAADIRRVLAELARLRADNVAAHQMACAAGLERDQLRAEVERLNALGSWAHTCIHHTDAERKAWVACPCCANARAERAEAALAEWSVLNLWGGTPEIIHEFIKGQQNRIHHCQDLEAECLEQARLLGMSGEREADLLGKIARLNRVIERASVQFFHDGSDGETAAKMLTVLNEAK